MPFDFRIAAGIGISNIDLLIGRHAFLAMPPVVLSLSPIAARFPFAALNHKLFGGRSCSLPVAGPKASYEVAAI
jgi:hypothetical protein